MAAALVGIEGKQAVVQPFQRHRQLERVPLEDIHTWAAGNAQPMETPNQPTSSQTPAEVPPTPPAQTAPTGDKLFTDGPWVVADVTNARFFVSSWAGFKPELNRARVYDNLRGANHCATIVRKSRVEDLGKVRVLTVQEAQEFLQERFHPTAAASETPQTPAEPPAPSRQTVPGINVAELSPEDLRVASDILRRMAEAEAMYREASVELQKVQGEWCQLARKIAGSAAEAAA